jgi:hypothetical protein
MNFGLWALCTTTALLNISKKHCSLADTNWAEKHHVLYTKYEVCVDKLFSIHKIMKHFIFLL